MQIDERGKTDFGVAGDNHSEVGRSVGGVDIAGAGNKALSRVLGQTNVGDTRRMIGAEIGVRKRTRILTVAQVEIIVVSKRGVRFTIRVGSKIGARGRNVVSERYGIASVVDAIEAGYRSLVPRT